MKRLILLRHGKAETCSPDFKDFSRPLALHGKQNAKNMGQYIFLREGTPDTILASDSTRTTETAQIVSKQLKFKQKNIKFEHSLYLASEYSLLNTAANLDEQIKTVLIIAHNPGLTYLINNFGVKLNDLPTCSAVCLYFKIEKWEDIYLANAKCSWKAMARDISKS